MMKHKPYAKLTPRERIINAIHDRIKCRRVCTEGVTLDSIHAAVEGYVQERGGTARTYYDNTTYVARERLFHAIRRSAA